MENRIDVQHYGASIRLAGVRVDGEITPIPAVLQIRSLFHLHLYCT